MESLSVSLSSATVMRNGSSSISYIKFGGTKIYGPSEQQITIELENVIKVIDQLARNFLTATKSVLRKKTCNSLGLGKIENRIFGALIGRQLRFGQLHSVVCSSQNGKIFKVFVHPSRIDTFQKAILSAKQLLEKRRAIQVSELEKIIFGEREYNTWSSTSHIFAHLSYIGIAEQVDKFSYRQSPFL